MTTEAPPSTTAPTAPVAPSTTAPTAPTAPAWHGYTDPADVAYVANKGWTGPQDAIKSYRGAETLIGRDPSQLLVMPRADDPAGMRAVYGKLGMPESADKYELDVPKGVTPDPNFQKWAKDTFHKVGLTAAQAKALSAEHNAFYAAQQAQVQKEYDTSVAADKTTLQNEWRGGFDRMMGMAKNAASALGYTGEMIDAMEQQIGYAATMKFFAGLGGKMGEDTLVTGGDKNRNFAGSMTPEEAKNEWEAKKLDKNFIAALQDASHPGHKNAQEQQTKLFKIMYPGG